MFVSSVLTGITCLYYVVAYGAAAATGAPLPGRIDELNEPGAGHEPVAL
jgi:hypothetical protein